MRYVLFQHSPQIPRVRAWPNTEDMQPRRWYLYATIVGQSFWIFPQPVYRLRVSTSWSYRMIYIIWFFSVIKYHFDMPTMFADPIKTNVPDMNIITRWPLTDGKTIRAKDRRLPTSGRVRYITDLTVVDDNIILIIKLECAFLRRSARYGHTDPILFYFSRKNRVMASRLFCFLYLLIYLSEYV